VFPHPRASARWTVRRRTAGAARMGATARRARIRRGLGWEEDATAGTAHRRTGRGTGVAVGERVAGRHATVWVEADRSRPSGRTLLVDGFASSYVDLDDPTYLDFAYMRRLAALLDALPGDAPRVVHVGGGACTLARYVAAARPGARQVVHERDEEVVRVARALLGLRTGPRLAVKVGDGRAGLTRRRDGSADAVVVDAFDGPAVPSALLTRGFLLESARVLRPGGLHLLNLIDGPGLGLSRAVAATLLAVFADVALVAERDVLAGRVRDNLVFAASDGTMPLRLLRARSAADGPRVRLLRRPQLSGFAGGAAPLDD